MLQDFYEDLFEELNKYGEIESLNVCDNLADHMVSFSNTSLDFVTFEDGFSSMTLDLFLLQVGNVYVQFREEEHAANALQNLTGRFYAGNKCCLILCTPAILGIAFFHICWILFK